MKAPETIFLRGYSFDDKPCKDWTLEPSKRGLRGYAVQNEKYIRKNALLEWAQKKNKRIDTEEGDYSLGYVSAMIELIEKIESL